MKIESLRELIRRVLEQNQNGNGLEGSLVDLIQELGSLTADKLFVVHFPPAPEASNHPSDGPQVPAKYALQAAQGALLIGWAFNTLAHLGFAVMGPPHAEHDPRVQGVVNQLRIGMEMMDAASAGVAQITPVSKLVVPR